MLEQYPYWRQQSVEKPLFPDILWSKPEQKSLAGKLGIIGGNKLGFVAVAESYQTAQNVGAGGVRVLLPDVLKKTIPATITDTIFAPSNPSGGLAQGALNDMNVLGEWATGVLMIGDAGRNSETAIVYENFLLNYKGPLTLTRDAVDLIKNGSQAIVERPKTLLVVSFAQLQKIFQNVYYPKILTFSMQLTQLVEALHKFTITYPITIMVLHNEQIISAHEGDIISTKWNQPMAIWRGFVATNAASFWLWNENSPLGAVSSSLCSQS